MPANFGTEGLTAGGLRNLRTDLVIPDGGLAYYDFEQDLSDSWNTNDGTNNGITFTTSSDRGTYAGVFDGVDDFGDISGFGVTGDASIIVSAYANSDFSADTEIIFWGDGAPQFQLQWRSGNVECFYFDGSSEVGNVTSNQPAGQYVRIAFVWRDATEAELYIDGTSVDTTSHTTNASISGTSSRIGAHGNDLTAYWDGRQDAVKFYNKALTDTEVSNEFSTGSIDG